MGLLVYLLQAFALGYGYFDLFFVAGGVEADGELGLLEAGDVGDFELHWFPFKALNFSEQWIVQQPCLEV